MEKSPKPDSKNQPLDPPENPFDVKEAIREGQMAPIGSYLRHDVPMILKLIADRFDHRGDESPYKSCKTDHDPADDQSQSGPNDDWDSNTLDVLQCIEDGKVAPVGWFLRDLADCLGDLGRVFDPEAASEKWKLAFSRRRRGPPIKARRKSFSVKMEIIERTQKFGKQEAAIQDLVDEGRMSRATVFRNLQEWESQKNPK
jgi:hypothetical protein